MEDQIRQAINESMASQKQFIEKEKMCGFRGIVSFFLNKMPCGKRTYIELIEKLYCFLCVENYDMGTHSIIVVYVF